MLITLPAHYNHPENKAKTSINPSFILHERARNYHWSGQSSLSIKTFFYGRALYTLGRGYYAVDDSSYLIVNHDQPYTIAIDAKQPVESFCLFFERDLVVDLYASLTLPTQTLLSNPLASTPTSLCFFERTYPHDTLLSPALFSLHTHFITAIPNSNLYYTIRLYEIFTDLLARLLQVQQRVFKEVETLPAVRATTRTEIYRRLYRAREYAHAFFDTPLTIPELAAVASLSPSHFLRLFKQLFHQTPHQYLLELRLTHARHLLSQTNIPITEICFSLGFESLGSFSWLFSQRIGCSPLTFRQQKK